MTVIFANNLEYLLMSKIAEVSERYDIYPNVNKTLQNLMVQIQTARS